MSKKRTTAKKQPTQKRASASRRPLWILGGIVLLIATAVATYFLLSTLLPRSDTADTATRQPASVAPAVTATPAEIIEAVQTHYEGRYTLLNIDENNQPADGQLSVRIGHDAPLFQVSDYNFVNDYDNGASIDLMAFIPPSDTATPSAADTKLRTEIAELLVKNGLQKDNQATGVYAFPGETVDTYTADNIFCTIQAPAAETSANSLRCGAISEYSNAAADYQPFVTLLTEATPEATATETPVVSHLEIRNSTTDGYQLASIAYSGATALFYKVPDGDWTYFTATQGTLPCSDYDTADLRAAYRSEPCVGPDQQTTQLF